MAKRIQEFGRPQERLTTFTTLQKVIWGIVALVALTITVIGFLTIIPGSPLFPEVEIKPPIIDPELSLGYARIDLQVLNRTSGIYESVNGTIAFVDYETDEILENNRFIENTDTFNLEQPTLLFVLDVNASAFSSVGYKNATILLLGSNDPNNPYLNVVQLFEKTVPGDLEIEIRNVNGMFGSYTVADLDVSSYFTLFLNSTDDAKVLGNLNYLPKDFRYFDNFSAMALVLEIDSEILNVSIGSTNTSFANIDGKGYIVLPTLLHGNNLELSMFINFVSTAPTAFTFYDGQVIPQDLILTET